MTREELRCPVCGYPLGFPPWKEASPSDEICPSCGIQFGYTDAEEARKDEARCIVYGAKNGLQLECLGGVLKRARETGIQFSSYSRSVLNWSTQIRSASSSPHRGKAHWNILE